MGTDSWLNLFRAFTGTRPGREPSHRRCMLTLTDSGIRALIDNFDATIATIDARRGGHRPPRRLLFPGARPGGRSGAARPAGGHPAVGVERPAAETGAGTGGGTGFPPARRAAGGGLGVVPAPPRRHCAARHAGRKTAPGSGAVHSRGRAGRRRSGGKTRGPWRQADSGGASHIQNPKDDFVGRLRAGAFSARAPARGLRQTESFRLRGPGFWPGEFRGRWRGAAATGRKAGRASHRSRVAAPVHPRSPAATNQAEAATRGPPIQRGRPSAKSTQNTWTRAAPRRIASPVSKNFGTGRGGILAASPTQSGKQRGPSPSCEAWARSARRRAAQEKARRASGRTLSQPLSQPRRATSTQSRVCVASEVTSRSMRV